MSTAGGRRWRNTPRLHRYVASLERGERPERELEELAPETQRQERLMLGLRLDEPLPLDDVAGVVDLGAIPRLQTLGLVRRGRTAKEPRRSGSPREGRRLGEE